MKKLLLPILIFTFFVTACSSEEAFEPQKCGFSCNATVDYNQTKFKAKILVGENGVFSAEVTEPEGLQGLSVEYGGENVKVSYLGIETEISPDEIPYFNYVSTTREILLSLGDRLKTIKTNGGYEYSGECSKGQYEVLFRADGFPLKINLPSHDLSITFENFEYVY